MSQPGVGWIQTITISRSPRFETRSSFELSKITIIDGNEAVGKTSLFEWICEAAGGRQAERWKGEEIRLDVRYSSPIPHRFEYSSNANGRDYRIDDVTFHLAPRDFQVVHVREEAVKARELPDDLLRIAGELGVDISVIRGLATEIIRNGSGYLSAIRFADRAQDPDSDESDPADCELLVTRTAAGFEQTYLSLSRSESFRIIVEFAAALARERARTSPTLLMIDGGGWNLSDGSWGEIIKLLLAQPYQSMLIVNYCERNSAEWNSCGRIYLRRPGKTDPSGRTVIEYRAVP
ncbi:hypothetical protein [Bradyrhizobium sp. 2TAF24]|uniref:hypothetical protein n=1 Tax=Bradyrhizobium sp. 2TAF24 TaxID=3233011 RepID=UPI003F91580B